LSERALPCALSIAGSDPSGGAGIEADLKTFTALQVYGACVVTAITVQDTSRVYDVHPVPAAFVGQQIKVVLSDLPVRSIKLGMLYARGVVKVVRGMLSDVKAPIVLDPVFRSGSGDPLIKGDAKEVLIKDLLPISAVVTPNVSEAEEICGFEIGSVEDLERAAEHIMSLGSKAVVIKGKHVDSEVVDLFLSEEKKLVFKKRRLDLNVHGAGCTFSSAIAAFLAHGCSLAESVRKAESFLEGLLSFSLTIGRGRRPVNQFVRLFNEAKKLETIEEVEKAAERLKAEASVFPYIADVGTQIAVALPYASSREQVIAVAGRITKFNWTRRSDAKPGSSTHMANVVLAAMKHEPAMRAALNLHYDEELLDAFQRLGYCISSFERKEEPEEVKKVEGATLRWGVDVAVARASRVPDVIYDLGESGKEPMIRVLGRSADEVVNKTLKALALLKQVRAQTRS
jgi:hydroxymethylpyrimidine/phosphomethylpyrimidine kinase